MTPRKVVVDTDVILDHLTGEVSGAGGARSILRQAMSTFFCYTTVFNVIELFEMCEDQRQRRAVENALGALKILGLNGKSGRAVGSVVRKMRSSGLRDIDALIGGLCVESGLPLLTGQGRSFRGVKSLRVLKAAEFSRSRPTGNRLKRSVKPRMSDS